MAASPREAVRLPPKVSESSPKSFCSMTSAFSPYQPRGLEDLPFQDREFTQFSLLLNQKGEVIEVFEIPAPFQFKGASDPHKCLKTIRGLATCHFSKILHPSDLRKWLHFFSLKEKREGEDSIKVSLIYRRGMNTFEKTYLIFLQKSLALSGSEGPVFFLSGNKV